ncbi:MAG: hypothetical protein V3T72_23295 [Thermoanaerobaculia bacterium]
MANVLQLIEADDAQGMLLPAARRSWEETYRQMATEDEDWIDWQNLPDEDSL